MTALTAKLGTTSLVVTLAGRTLPLDRTAAVTINQGRDAADQQPEAATCQISCYADALDVLPAIGDALSVSLGSTARAWLGLPATYRSNALNDPSLEGASIPTEISGYFNPTRELSTAEARSGAKSLKMTTTRTDFGQGIVWLTPANTAVPLGYLSKSGIWVKGPAGLSVDVRGWATNGAGTVNFSQSKANVRTVLTGAWQYIETAAWTITASDTNVGTNTTYRPAVAALLVPPAPAVGTVLYFDDGTVTYQTDADWQAAQPRFVGHVTDVRAAPSGPGILTVTATAAKARLGRVVVGDVPWPAELDGPRASRILAAAQTATGNAFTVGTIDPGTVTVLGRDVDSQAALGLLDELANHAGAVFTARRDGTLEWHDAEHRRNVTQNAIALTAANVLANAVWQQSLAGVVNDLSFTYGPDTGTGQASTRLQDSVSRTTYGPLASQLSTQLLDLAAADVRLADILGRRSRPRWRLDTVELDVLRTVTPALASQLALMELGNLLTITGFPSWGPYVTARLYVEGWTETFSPDGWRMQLAVSEYALSGPAPRWADVPDSWTWSTTPADLTWLSAAGWWPGEAVAGRWLDVPADLSWSEPPTSTTWTAADAIWT